MPEQLNDQKILPLDGLRGIAVLSVSLGHIFYQFYIAKIGWVGLNLFFILSGYLITGRLYHHLEQGVKKYFRNFYTRRVLRIFPLYYGCLFVFFVVLPIVYSHYFLHFSGLYERQVWYWLYAGNWLLILHGLSNNPSLFHFWSLAVEEQFYICWPFIFLISKGMTKKIVIAILIAISIIVRINTPSFSIAYCNTLTAAEPLLLGAFICVIQKERLLHNYYKIFLVLAILSLLGLFFIFYNDGDLHISNRPLMQFGYSCIDIIWAFVLYLLLLQTKLSGFCKNILSARWLTWLGKYSYGIYVFHWFVLQLFVYKYETMLVERGVNIQLAYYAIRIIAIIGILTCSYISYNYYERYFLRLKKYFD